MTQILDLSKKKPAMPVKLPDETLIRVYAPTKGMLEQFITIGETLEKVNNDSAALDEAYAVVAMIMSNNAGGRKVTAKELSETLDFGDIIVFVKAYTAFVSELANAKN